jgi:hypothetical protein
VLAVFAGGRDLAGSPRFLLAQDARRRVVGVACPARELSERMHFDGRRELSCFVGWVADRPLAAMSPWMAGPALPDLRREYARWAAPVYQEVMGHVWDLPHSPFREPAVTEAAVPPWDTTGGDVDYDLAEPVPPPGRGLWPPATWPALWTAALTMTGPFTCVVGWEQAGLARREGVTHLGVTDAPPRVAPDAPRSELVQGGPGTGPAEDGKAEHQSAEGNRARHRPIEYGPAVGDLAVYEPTRHTPAEHKPTEDGRATGEPAGHEPTGHQPAEGGAAGNRGAEDEPAEDEAAEYGLVRWVPAGGGWRRAVTRRATRARALTATLRSVPRGTVRPRTMAVRITTLAKARIRLASRRARIGAVVAALVLIAVVTVIAIWL